MKLIEFLQMIRDHQDDNHSRIQIESFLETQGPIAKELYEHTIKVLTLQQTIDQLTSLQLETNKWMFTDFLKVNFEKGKQFNFVGC